MPPCSPRRSNPRSAGAEPLIDGCSRAKPRRCAAGVAGALGQEAIKEEKPSPGWPLVRFNQSTAGKYQRRTRVEHRISPVMNYYNGYTPKEREKKLREHHKQFPNRSHPYYGGSCQMCGDPHSSVAPHSEDYSEPFLWYEPAEYALCRVCHSRIHRRFRSPFAWEVYKPQRCINRPSQAARVVVWRAWRRARRC